MKLTYVIAFTLLACDAMAQTPKPITHGRPPVVDSIIPDLGLPKASRGRRSKGSIEPPAAKPVDRCALTPEEQTLFQNLRVALNRMRKRKLELDAREAMLKALMAQVRAEMESLREMQRKIKAKDKKKDGEDIPDSEKSKKDKEAKAKAEREARKQKRAQERRARIAELAAILKKMKPQDAANILARADNDVANAALKIVGPRVAGQIVAKLPADRASELMKALVDGTPDAEENK